MLKYLSFGFILFTLLACGGGESDRAAMMGDTTPPSIPTISLQNTLVTYDSITLQWSESNDNVGMSHYLIYRDDDTTAMAQVNTTQYIDPNLELGVTYRYTISAVDTANNESVLSEAASFTTLLDTEPPTTPANLSASNITGNSVSLNWHASTDNHQIMGYRLYRDGQTTPRADIISNGYTDTTLSPATSYQYTVTAYDTVGNESAHTNVLSVTTSEAADTTPPSIPTISLQNTLVTYDSIALQWSESNDNVGMSHYLIYRDGDATAIAQVSSNSYTDINLEQGVTYQYTVSAVDTADNESALSEAANFTTLLDTEPPTTPANLSASNITENLVSLSWHAASDNLQVVGYRLYRDGQTTPLADVTNNHYTDTTLSPTNNYVYTVTAYDTAGNESAHSNVLTITTSETAPFLPVGTNLDGVNYWTPTMPFADALRMGSHWDIQYKKGGGAPKDDLIFDDNGYPVSLPPHDDGENGSRERVAITYILLGNYDEISGTARAPSGTYSLTWEGEGKIIWGHHKGHEWVTINSETIGENRVDRDYESIGKGFVIRIQGTGDENGANPITKINLWMPGYENSGKTFTDWAIADAQSYDTIRTMDLAQTNFSLETTWDKRIKPDYIFQGRNGEGHFMSGGTRYRDDATGLAWEHIIQLANRVGSDFWINIPARVDDNYIIQLAKLMRDTLDPNIKLYLEYSNEVWNSGTFPVFNYSKAQGILRGYHLPEGGDNGEVLAGFRFQGARSVEIFDIFYSEFGSAAESRLVRVVAGQSTNPAIFGKVLNFEYPVNSGNYVSDKVDALAIAPYFGHKVISEMFNDAPLIAIDPEPLRDTSAYTVDDLMAKLTAHLRDSIKNDIKNNAKLAEDYGKKLIAYEGGQHLTNETGDTHLQDLLVEAQYSDAMGDLYREYLGYWFLHGKGGLFSHYTNITPCSTYGCWGARQFFDQTEDEAPKYKALMDVRNKRSIIATPEFDNALAAYQQQVDINQVLFDFNEKNTGTDNDLGGRAIDYSITSTYPTDIFSFDSNTGKLSMINPNAIDWSHRNEYSFDILASNSFASSEVTLGVMLGHVIYEDLSTWQTNLDLTVISEGEDTYTLIRGERAYGLLRYNLPTLNNGDSIRVRFSAAIGVDNINPVSLVVNPYLGFADQADTQIVIKESDPVFFDSTYVNNTGSTIDDGHIFFSFNTSNDSQADRITVSNMLVDVIPL